MAEHDFPLRQVRETAGLLNSLASSYRMLVDAAHQFNSISLAHRHDVEEAIDRADELGEIIDEVLAELKKQVRGLFFFWRQEIFAETGHCLASMAATATERPGKQAGKRAKSGTAEREDSLRPEREEDAEYGNGSEEEIAEDDTG